MSERELTGFDKFDKYPREIDGLSHLGDSFALRHIFTLGVADGLFEVSGPVRVWSDWQTWAMFVDIMPTCSDGRGVSTAKCYTDHEIHGAPHVAGWVRNLGNQAGVELREFITSHAARENRFWSAPWWKRVWWAVRGLSE